MFAEGWQEEDQEGGGDGICFGVGGGVAQPKMSSISANQSNVFLVLVSVEFVLLLLSNSLPHKLDFGCGANVSVVRTYVRTAIMPEAGVVRMRTFFSLEVLPVQDWFYLWKAQANAAASRPPLSASFWRICNLVNSFRREIVF